MPNLQSNKSEDKTSIVRVCYQAFFNQSVCSSDVNTSGKHSAVSTSHRTGHFQRKNKNGCD